MSKYNHSWENLFTQCEELGAGYLFNQVNGNLTVLCNYEARKESKGKPDFEAMVQATILSAGIGMPREPHQVHKAIKRFAKAKYRGLAAARCKKPAIN
jgi:hypothetical protein